MCIINDWLGLVNLRSHGSINTYTNIQRGRNSVRLHTRSLSPRSEWGRPLLKKLLRCLRLPAKLENRCVTRKRTDEQESGSRKREKDGSFFLKHVQGLKDSAAHPYPNFLKCPRTRTQDKNTHFCWTARWYQFRFTGDLGFPLNCYFLC